MLKSYISSHVGIRINFISQKHDHVINTKSQIRANMASRKHIVEEPNVRPLVGSDISMKINFFIVYLICYLEACFRRYHLAYDVCLQKIIKMEKILHINFYF